MQTYSATTLDTLRALAMFLAASTWGGKHII